VFWPRRSQPADDNWSSVIFFPGRIDIAEVRRNADARPALCAWDSVAFDGTELDALKQLRARLRGHRCTTLLHHNKYQLVQIEAPQVPIEERREAVRWRIKEMVNFPVEQAGIDVLDIPVAQGGSVRGPQIFAVAAAHAVLAPRIHQFQDAKIPLAAIDIPELAQRNVAALFEEENRGLALLAFDAEGGRLTFTFQGELYAARHIDVGAKELSAPGGEAPGGVFERVLLDVQRSLDNFDRNYSFITLTRLLVAPIPGAAAFVEYLKGNLYQPVALLDLAEGLDLGQVPGLANPEQQADALLAIGAALRGEAAT
jgi:MSHA biogenesis protein MshI